MKRPLLILLAILSICICRGKAHLNIVPVPVEVQEREGAFRLSSNTQVCVADKSLERVAAHYVEQLRKLGVQGLRIAYRPHRSNVINLSLAEGLGEEQYLLDISDKQIVVKGGSEKALFYGLQTLRQIVSASNGDADGVLLAGVHIWRQTSSIAPR